MDLTSTQIAALAGVSERTAQRWLREGRLHAQPLPNGRYRVSEADLAVVMPPDTATLVERIEALENDVRALRAEIDELRQEQARKTPPTRVLKPAPAQYMAAPGDQVTARSFAEAHGLTREQMRTMIDQGRIATTQVPFHGKTQHQLNPGQQHAAILYWQESHTPYTPCPQCPHET